MSDNKTDKSTDSHYRIITIIISLITAVIGAPTIFNIISDVFFSPNIQMQFPSDNITKTNFLLEVTNVGNEAANHYSLTVVSPYNITRHDLFLTENSTNVKELELNQKTLQIFTPRLVPGQAHCLD